MEVLSKERFAETVGAATVGGVNAVIEEWLGKPLPRLCKGVPPCPQARPSFRLPPPEPLPPYPLLVISPPACLKHNIPGHFERPARLTAILHALHPPSRLPSLPPPHSPPSLPPSAFLLSDADCPRATHEQLARFHTTQHLAHLASLFAESQTLAATSQVQEPSHLDPSSSPHLFPSYPPASLIDIDGDTTVCPGTEEATLRAAGAACRGVEEVMEGRAESVWCLVRPPGHHATPSQSMGFCFVNHAGVAAMHARARYGVRRVAVLDPDVHHGNGTQDGFRDDPDLFYASTHVGYGFYPGTGSRKDAKGREDRLVNVPFREGEGSSEKFRQAWAEEIFPKLRKFQPELIILSMGFDAVAEDPLGEMELRPEDFEWFSREVRRVGGRKGGREGGREGCEGGVEYWRE
ncbi:histone deacetylase superfamily protein, partial [Nannochloropsis gaditana CCMP526]|uniref:histone deacetylase superfamily protein n=1 Tax=Nannochloropsis gaditana (strain CCMP526) TaxID=1093141 RepID=UPI00029F7CE3